MRPLFEKVFHRDGDNIIIIHWRRPIKVHFNLKNGPQVNISNFRIAWSYEISSSCILEFFFHVIWAYFEEMFFYLVSEPKEEVSMKSPPPPKRPPQKWYTLPRKLANTQRHQRSYCWNQDIGKSIIFVELYPTGFKVGINCPD